MNIWILNHYAGTPDDNQTTGNYELGRQLVKKGHVVTIFASGFGHRGWRDEKLKSEEVCKVEYYNGVRFIWIRTVPYRRNDWRRAANMLSYTWRSCWAGMRMRERPAVVIGTCPHPLAVASACVLSGLKRSRFFFEVRDLWAETIVDSEVLSRSHLITRVVKWVETSLLRRADRIITLLPHIYQHTRAIGIPDERITWIPNGVDLEAFRAIPKVTTKGSRVFTVMYVGGFARYNGVSTILEAAGILRDRGANHVKFVLVGDGPEKVKLMQRAAELHLTNVEFSGSMPKREIPRAMQAADAFAYTVRSISELRYGISPQKLYEYMASGRPVVFAADAPNNPIEEASAGVTVAAENSEALAQGVLQLERMSDEERDRMGRNGIEYVRRYHDVSMLGDRL